MKEKKLQFKSKPCEANFSLISFPIPFFNFLKSSLILKTSWTWEKKTYHLKLLSLKPILQNIFPYFKKKKFNLKNKILGIFKEKKLLNFVVLKGKYE